MVTALLILGLIVCIVMSAYFSASEMSYSSCNLLRLENAKEDGDKRAVRAFKISQKFDDALGAILIGNNLVNIAASSIGSVLIIELTGSDDLSWISTVVITVLVIIFGETIPKILAKQQPTEFALFSSGFLNLLMTVLKPVIFVVVKLVDLITGLFKVDTAEVDEDDALDEALEELTSLIETAEDEDVLEEDQSDLVQAAIDFLDVSAMEVMTARVDITALDISASEEEILALIDESDYSRIPVYEDSIDNIIGILFVNKYLKAITDVKNADLKSLLMEPVYVYKTTKLTSVLDQLRAAKQHMAIVCDEYGGTKGLVTMEDILEQIVGEIWDETDEIEEDVKEITENKSVIDGNLVISEFCELYDIDEENFETESDTVGGWVLEHFESYPTAGDSFEDEGFKVTILKMGERRVESLLVEKILPDTEDC